MKTNCISKFLLVSLFAIVVNSFIYFSFGNIYSSSVLNYTDFQNQFQSGIYQYRILSGYFLNFAHDFLSTLSIDYQLFRLKFTNHNAEPQMYLSFYLLNTGFLVLSGFVMTLITESKSFIASESEKILLIIIALFTIAISQFVIVPYDVSSYFFLLAFFFFLIKYLEKNTPFYLLILGVLMVISTLNRESSALSLSLMAIVLYTKFGLKKETIVPIAVLGFIFISVYLGMRVMSENFSTNDGNLFTENFSQPKNFLGMLFWLIFFLFTLILAKDKKAVRMILIFHFLSLPYILMCIYTGILYEIRLYVPLFLTALFLGKTEFREKSKN